MTYFELKQSILCCASYLKKNGVCQGDPVFLTAHSDREFLSFYWATHLLGAISVPLDPKINPSTLVELANLVGPKIHIEHGKSVPLDNNSLENLSASTHSEQVADLIFTTGTTGRPKGVILTQGNLAAAVRNITAFIGNIAGDREVIPLPLHHSFGLGRMRCALASGGAVILVPGFARPKQIYDSIEKWEAVGLCSVPAGLAFLLKISESSFGKSCANLKFLEIGSAPMPQEQKQKLMSLLPRTRICMHYGLTEASRSAFIEFHQDQDHLDSIGRAAPNVEITIRDDHFLECPPQKEGEVWVSAGTTSPGYWQDEEKTRKSRNEKWLRTDDFGFKDELGFLYLTGRKSDLINVGGKKVAPSEIEDAMAKHPAVQEAACIGVPDPQGLSSEAIKAFWVPKDFDLNIDREEFTRFLKEHLEAHKIPIAFEKIGKLPKTASGKLQRSELKKT